MAGEHDSATTEHEFAASFRLRGGYDTNPEFSSGNGIGGSAFIASDTALAAGSKDGNTILGVAAEANSIHYANPLATPTLGGKVILRGSLGDDDFKLSSTTTIADVSSYNLRSSDLTQSVKAETKVDSLKLFVTAEGGRSSLNQTNAIFQDFLPSPHQYWRATLVPGSAWCAARRKSACQPTFRSGVTSMSSTTSVITAITNGCSRSLSRSTRTRPSPRSRRSRGSMAGGTTSISAMSTARCSMQI
jgi:hypothetical protein